MTAEAEALAVAAPRWSPTDGASTWCGRASASTTTSGSSRPRSWWARCCWPCVTRRIDENLPPVTNGTAPWIVSCERRRHRAQHAGDRHAHLPRCRLLDRPRRPAAREPAVLASRAAQLRAYDHDQGRARHLHRDLHLSALQPGLPRGAHAPRPRRYFDGLGRRGHGTRRGEHRRVHRLRDPHDPWHAHRLRDQHGRRRDQPSARSDVPAGRALRPGRDRGRSALPTASSPTAAGGSRWACTWGRACCRRSTSPACVRLAREHECLVRLTPQVGQYVGSGEPLFELFAGPAGPASLPPMPTCCEPSTSAPSAPSTVTRSTACAPWSTWPPRRCRRRSTPRPPPCRSSTVSRTSCARWPTAPGRPACSPTATAPCVSSSRCAAGTSSSTSP